MVSDCIVCIQVVSYYEFSAELYRMHRKPKKAKFSSVSADRAAESDKDI